MPHNAYWQIKDEKNEGHACFSALRRSNAVMTADYIHYYPHLKNSMTGLTNQSGADQDMCAAVYRIMTELPAFRATVLNWDDPLDKLFAFDPFNEDTGFRVRLDVPSDWCMIVLSWLRYFDEYWGWNGNIIPKLYAIRDADVPPAFKIILAQALMCKTNNINALGDGHVHFGVWHCDKDTLLTRIKQLQDPDIDVTKLGKQPVPAKCNGYSPGQCWDFWTAHSACMPETKKQLMIKVFTMDAGGKLTPSIAEEMYARLTGETT